MKRILLSMVLLLSGANLLGIVASNKKLGIVVSNKKFPILGVDTPQGIRPDGLPYGSPEPYQHRTSLFSTNEEESQYRIPQSTRPPHLMTREERMRMIAQGGV